MLSQSIKSLLISAPPTDDCWLRRLSNSEDTLMEVYIWYSPLIMRKGGHVHHSHSCDFKPIFLFLNQLHNDTYRPLYAW